MLTESFSRMLLALWYSMSLSRFLSSHMNALEMCSGKPDKRRLKASLQMAGLRDLETLCCRAMSLDEWNVEGVRKSQR